MLPGPIFLFLSLFQYLRSKCFARVGGFHGVELYQHLFHRLPLSLGLPANAVFFGQVRFQRRPALRRA